MLIYQKVSKRNGDTTFMRVFIHSHVQNEYLKKELQPNIITSLLANGLIKPNKVREIQGTTLLERVNEGLVALRKGTSGERIVIRVSEA